MKEATAAHPTERRGLSHGRFPETNVGDRSLCWTLRTSQSWNWRAARRAPVLPLCIRCTKPTKRSPKTEANRMWGG